MLIKEFRIVLPISVEEYQTAQLYSVAEASKNETGGGEGIEVVANEPFEEMEDLKKGQYTHKIFHLASRVPGFIRLLAPKGSLEFHEKAWNAYPYCRTIVTNPDYMKDDFLLKIETWHRPNKGTEENVHKLDSDVWKSVEVVNIDIANDPVQASDYKPEEDASKFRSEKAGRGPLGPKWIENLPNESPLANGDGACATPHMCCYKLITCNFKWFGLQKRVEKMIQNQERRLLANFHRQVFCWMDKWYGLTIEDIRRIEEQTKKDLDEMRNQGSIRGMKCEENK